MQKQITKVHTFYFITHNVFNETLIRIDQRANSNLLMRHKKSVNTFPCADLKLCTDLQLDNSKIKLYLMFDDNSNLILSQYFSIIMCLLTEGDDFFVTIMGIHTC